MLAIQWVASSTEDDRKWKNKEYQRMRKEWAENHFEEYDGSIVPIKMHKKYGYRYDPWYPELRDKIIETEKSRDIHGESITEILEIKYNVDGKRKNPVVKYRITETGEIRHKEIKRQFDAQVVVNVVNRNEIEIIEVENPEVWKIMKEEAERNI